MERFPGYTLVRTEDCPEQHGTLTVLTHDVSGATVLLVENEDTNKAFGIGFGTFPSDDTGVFHILEHSVLAGSEKYPVTSPFLQLLKSSMASFLNAMTFPDKTVYPFATPNETDFKNLMDVYLNAVFCPLAMVDKSVFEQEGWHRSADGTVSGVVYNEMQGALAALLTGTRQLGFVTQGKNHIRQAGRKHYHPAGPGLDVYAVYLHREFPCRRHSRDDLLHLRATGKSSACQQHAQQQSRNAPQSTDIPSHRARHFLSEWNRQNAPKRPSIRG